MEYGLEWNDKYTMDKNGPEKNAKEDKNETAFPIKITNLEDKDKL